MSDEDFPPKKETKRKKSRNNKRSAGVITVQSDEEIDYGEDVTEQLPPYGKGTPKPAATKSVNKESQKKATSKKRKTAESKKSPSQPKKKSKCTSTNTESNCYAFIEVVEDALDSVNPRKTNLYDFGIHLLSNYYEVSLIYLILYFFQYFTEKITISCFF